MKKSVHFIGIGGIGTSALAKYFLKKHWKVSGSDLISSEITENLKKIGAKVIIGPHQAKNISKNIDLVIYSPAIQKNNPELLKVLDYNLKTQSYPETLGELTKKYFTVAVCGTHGKSTTTAMIGILLTKAGFDPTVIVGTKVKEFKNSNCRVGKSQYLVIEADEHFASFLNYWPKIIVLTRIEPDHLDYFKNFKNYLLAFKNFISHLPNDGYLVANKDDQIIYNNFSKTKKNILWYSLKDKESKKLRKTLKIPGEFNVSNALSTLRVARILKIPDKASFKILSKYKGTWRRFEEKNLKIKNLKFKIISDYGHHPTEVRVTLEAARKKYPKNKIFCIFQPHQYQRTYYLFKDFVRVLKNSPINEIIITDIYEVKGREDKKIKKKVNAQKLVKAINKKNVIYLPKKEIIPFLKKNLENGNIFIFMGAGDIYELTKIF